MSTTFKDLMKFQKSQIVYEMTVKVMEGKLFTWSAQTDEAKHQTVTVCLDEQSDVPVTLPSEVKSVVNKALTTFNRALLVTNWPTSYLTKRNWQRDYLHNRSIPVRIHVYFRVLCTCLNNARNRQVIFATLTTLFIGYCYACFCVVKSVNGIDFNK